MFHLLVLMLQYITHVYSFFTIYLPLAYIKIVSLQLFHTEMDSMKKLTQISLGDQNCKLLARLTRLWDSKNMKSKYGDSGKYGWGNC
jgi:hypothetical protein